MNVFKALTITTVSAAALAFAGIAAAGQYESGKAKMMEKTEAMMPKADIVDVAVSSADFSTLVAAVKAAGLVDTLKSDGPFTVFAPTNAAFDALPEGTVASLLKPENKDKLIAVLTYHVIPGKVLSTDLSGEMSVATVQGEEVEIIVGSAGVTIDGANVTGVDIMASNGVIHVIDSVILPAAASESR